jgi:polyribonucleotide nucleotidyltransferase
MVLSADPDNDPGVLAIVGAGAALAISDIPFHHLVSAVRVGMVDGKYVVNPTYSETRAHRSSTSLLRPRPKASCMVEAGAQQVSEAEVLGALELATNACKKIIAAVKQLVAAAGKTKKVFTPRTEQGTLRRHRQEGPRGPDRRAGYEEILQARKLRRIDALHEVVEEPPEEQKDEAGKIFKHLKERIFRDEMLDARRRPDGRKFDEVRDIWGEAGVLPRTHGSALFHARRNAGAGNGDARHQGRRAAHRTARSGRIFKRFMLHYNFPPFSVGEVGFMRGRAVAKSATARWPNARSSAVLPDEAKFPYTLRVVSDILESNGSSSMATVCGASIALMDAGVPITAPVGGVAMGLVKEGDKYAILTDIAGAEDHYGDMDFKVAGTKDGITALQMDIKVAERHHGADEGSARTGAPGPAAHSGQDGRGAGTRARDMSPYAPRIYTMKIPAG